MADKQAGMQGSLFLVAAPSGAGKTTLVTKVIDRIKHDRPIERLVTYTSRAPRPSDIPGQDYHFLTVTDFEAKIAQSFFLEWSTTYGTYYGTPRHEFAKLDQGISLIIIVDRQGARDIISHYKEAITIWIQPPDCGTLAQRLKSRYDATGSEIDFRLRLAQQELKEEQEEGLFTYKLLNEDLELALERFESIIRANKYSHLTN
jgi:guanylate kinase